MCNLIRASKRVRERHFKFLSPSQARGAAWKKMVLLVPVDDKQSSRCNEAVESSNRKSDAPNSNLNFQPVSQIFAVGKVEKASIYSESEMKEEGGEGHERSSLPRKKWRS